MPYPVNLVPYYQGNAFGALLDMGKMYAAEQLRANAQERRHKFALEVGALERQHETSLQKQKAADAYKQAEMVAKYGVKGRKIGADATRYAADTRAGTAAAAEAGRSQRQQAGFAHARKMEGIKAVNRIKAQENQTADEMRREGWTQIPIEPGQKPPEGAVVAAGRAWKPPEIKYDYSKATEVGGSLLVPKYVNGRYVGIYDVKKDKEGTSDPTWAQVRKMKERIIAKSEFMGSFYHTADTRGLTDIFDKKLNELKKDPRYKHSPMTAANMAMTHAKRVQHGYWKLYDDIMGKKDVDIPLASGKGKPVMFNPAKASGREREAKLKELKARYYRFYGYTPRQRPDDYYNPDQQE